MSEYSGTDNLEVMAEAQNYNRFLLNSILKASGETSAILDFGAGSGTFSKMVQGSGRSVTCIELDDQLSQRLEKMGFPVQRNFEAQDAGAWKFIYSLNVLEHIENDRAALQEIFRALRPEGGLYLYVPAFQILFSSMDEKVGHFRRYHKADLIEKLKSVGFQIQSAKYVDSLGFLAAWLYKCLGKKDGSINLRMLIFFDRAVFPISRFLDIFFHPFLGKNLEIVAKKTPASSESRLS